jgi:hypothetical protein
LVSILGGLEWIDGRLRPRRAIRERQNSGRLSPGWL